MSYINDYVMNSVPSGIIQKFEKTPIESLFIKLQYRFENIENVSVDTSAGEINIHLVEGGFIYEHIANRGKFHPGLINKLNSHWSKSSVFYDIGAHCGYVSKVASAAGVPPSNIHSFEKSGFQCKLLNRNTKEQVQITRGRVGKENAISIDDYTKFNDPPTILKIDVEGDEREVLAGAIDCLTKHHPVVIVEIHPVKMQKKGFRHTDIPNMLEQVGYTRFEYLNHWEAPDWSEYDYSVEISDKQYQLYAVSE